ncbi:MAG: hypothetical protein AB8I08_09505 [Sandaracinaceae bacterium]
MRLPVSIPMSIVLVCAVVLSACGASSPPSTTPPDASACRAAQAEAETRWQAVTEAAQAVAEGPEAASSPATDALATLEQHVQSLHETPRELDGEEAMALSNAMMDGIDALGAALPDAEREAADDAAEALLTDRSRDGARRSATHALAAFEAALQIAQPTTAAERAERRTAGELAQRARRAAEAYATGIEEGDRAADRAEVAPLPEGDTRLGTLRDAATEASQEARQVCRVPRTLAAPGL